MLKVDLWPFWFIVDGCFAAVIMIIVNILQETLCVCFFCYNRGAGTMICRGNRLLKQEEFM